MIIADIEQLGIEAQDIQCFLDEPIPDEGNLLIERIITLNSYLSRTGKMLADAKYHYSCKKRNEDKCMEMRLVTWIDRINNTCGRQIDTCRTLISKLKEEMKMNNANTSI